MLAIPTRPYFRALYWMRYTCTRWINGLGTRLGTCVRAVRSVLEVHAEFCNQNKIMELELDLVNVIKMVVKGI